MSPADSGKSPDTSESRISPGSRSRKVSRRQFGRDAVVATAATVGASSLFAVAPGIAEAVPAQRRKPEPLKGLTPQQIAEVEAKLADILRKYGSRFNEGQKAHLRRILAQNERLLAPVRAFAVENGDPPASVLRVSFESAGQAGEG